MGQVRPGQIRASKVVMAKPDPEIYSGLPWPDGYEDLRPLILEQWGLTEIYLARKLAGGKSGVLVYAADITGKDHSGQAIIKFDHASDSATQEKSEAKRHETAFAAAPDFAANHLPRLLHTLHSGKNLALLSTVAGRGLEYSVTWHESDWQVGVTSLRNVARDLLEDWNSDYRLTEGIVMPRDLLAGWLGYRLDPAQSRIHAFLRTACGLDPNEPSFIFEGQWFPNPLVFAASTSELPDRLRLRAVTGHCHGDFHGRTSWSA